MGFSTSNVTSGANNLTVTTINQMNAASTIVQDSALNTLGGYLLSECELIAKNIDVLSLTVFDENKFDDIGATQIPASELISVVLTNSSNSSITQDLVLQVFFNKTRVTDHSWLNFKFFNCFKAIFDFSGF